MLKKRPSTKCRRCKGFGAFPEICLRRASEVRGSTPSAPSLRLASHTQCHHSGHSTAQRNTPHCGTPQWPQVTDGAIQFEQGFGTTLPAEDEGLCHFDGLSNQCGCLPPDTCVAVGQNHVVETVNTHVAIYDKSGSRLFPEGFPETDPMTTGDIWAGFAVTTCADIREIPSSCTTRRYNGG